MQIKEIILERRQQRTEIMYHGTSSNLVPSILKHGLLARPPKKTYDLDTYGASTASMGGVYVTPIREYAETIAQEAVGTHGGEPAMVTIQYVLGSGDTDEDSLTLVIHNSVNSVMFAHKLQAPDSELDQYDMLSYPHEGWAVDYMVKNRKKISANVTKRAVEQLQQFSRTRHAVAQIIQKIVIGFLEQASRITDTRERWSFVRFGAQDVIREKMEPLLDRLMKQVSLDNAPGGHKEKPRRIDRDVKFKGKTRIIKIEIGSEVVYPR